MKKVRVGIIGCGGIAHWFHLPELAEIGEAELIGVADLREVRAKETAKKFGAKDWFTDYKKLLEMDDIDAIIVATYHPLHSPIAIEAIKAGKHTLVQKPMATKMEDADELVKVAEKSDVTVMALPFSNYPIYETVKRMLEDDILGDICMARSRIAHSGPDPYYKSTLAMFGEEPETTWFFLKDVAEGGVLFDMGVYAISMITDLIGPAKKVSGFTSRTDKEIEVEDNAVLTLQFANGVIGSIETSWTQQASREGLAIYGTMGTLYMDPNERRLQIYSNKKYPGGWFEPAGGQMASLASQHQRIAHRHFIDCILNKKKPLATPQHGRHVVEIMLAGYRSAETGETVEIKSTF